MSKPKDAYVKLLLWRSPSGRDIWLKTLRETADFYGWTAAYDEWTPPQIGMAGNGRSLHGYPTASPAHHGGLRLRICRSGTKMGHPKGKTNCFRVSKSVSNALLTELVSLTKEPIAWMEDKAFRRWTYDEWMERLVPAQRILASTRAGGLN